ncbi:MAG: Bax inhibitor-1 family protein, partial [Victivallaceae bacterium]
GGFLMMVLIGVVIGSVINLFWQNSTLYWITTYLGFFIFVGLTAYDTQKIRQMSEQASGMSGEMNKKLSIMGALALYLDFINLFLLLLRLFGGRRN